MKVKLNKVAQSVAAAGEAKDNSRPVLTNICVRKGRVIAGNGFILATAPVEVEGDEGKDMLIPIAMVAALQEASPLAKKVGIEVEDAGAELIGAEVYDKQLGDVRKARGVWQLMTEPTEEEVKRVIELQKKYSPEQVRVRQVASIRLF